MRFHTKLLLIGKTSTGFRVPEEVVEALGAGKRPPVRVTLNGYTYQNTIAPMGGEYWLGVSAEHRQGAGVAAGDELDVDIVLDTELRQVSLPPDFAEALDQDAGARRAFDRLSYSSKRRYVFAIEEAKTAETRRRRIAKVIGELREGRG